MLKANPIKKTLRNFTNLNFFTSTLLCFQRVIHIHIHNHFTVTYQLYLRHTKKASKSHMTVTCSIFHAPKISEENGGKYKSNSFLN